MKDPFEAALEEQNLETPPESPIHAEEEETVNVQPQVEGDDYDGEPNLTFPQHASSSARPSASTAVVGSGGTGRGKEEDEEEDEEENMDVDMRRVSSGDPDKMAKMKEILSQFTDGQMSRYESFRRSGFQKSNMKRLIISVTGTQKISLPMTIAVSGIAKMFVGELIETARIVMTERKENGPIRPCHIRESYRRLKLEGKIPSLVYNCHINQSDERLLLGSMMENNVVKLAAPGVEGRKVLLEEIEVETCGCLYIRKFVQSTRQEKKMTESTFLIHNSHLHTSFFLPLSLLHCLSFFSSMN